MTVADLLPLLGVVLLTVALVSVVAWRRRTHAAHVNAVAGVEVCEHLRPALDLLRSRGHQVTRVGQNDPDLPFEVHFVPTFEPQRLYDELKLTEPVFVSERNVLYCKADWCELHPKP